MNLHIHHHHHFDASLKDFIMSVVSDKVAALTAACNAALARSQAEVTALKAQLATAQADAASPDDLAAIDAATNTINSIDSSSPMTIPPATPTPPTP